MALTLWRGDDQRNRLEALASESDETTTSWLRSPPDLDGQRTVSTQAVAVAHAHGLDQPPDLADFVVDLLNADDLLDKTPWHFSRGEKQMAGLVLAFARPFERLMLIEPTAGLDARRADAVLAFLHDLAQDVDIDVATSRFGTGEEWCSA